LDDAADEAEKALLKEKGAQLIPDILFFGQNGKGSIKWVFDATMTKEGKDLFMKIVMDSIKTPGALRNRFKSALKLKDDKAMDLWIKNLDLEEFIDVLPTV
jgi:hypothetical protein